MSTIQFELKKAALARQILNADSEEFIEKLTASMNRILHKEGDIPGLAYTTEERIAEIRLAEKELEDGETGISHEEFMKHLDDRIKSWK